MEDNSYTSVHEAVYKAISAKILRKGDDSGLQFAPRGTIRTLFENNDYELLRRVFQSLSTNITDSAESFISNDDINTFIRRTNERKLSTFIGTVIYSGCTVEALTALVRRFILPETLPDKDIASALLPLPRELLSQIFVNQNDVERFDTHQQCFCPLVLLDRETTQHHEPHRRLPYISEEPLGEGSFGKVFRVRIATNHFRHPYTNMRNGVPLDLARKDYHVNANRKDEYDTMKELLESLVTHRNIVHSLGFLQMGTKFSLFMPLALCDLQKYMKTNHSQEITSKADLFFCAAGLSAGLDFLHSGIQNRNFETLVCYHMDLKPSNILVFDDGKHHVWKISDFSISTIKPLTQKVKEPSTGNFNKLFIRNPASDNNNSSQSGVANPGGEGTYTAPESADPNAVMKTGSDVWALGCVISVLLSYMEGGGEAIDSYSLARSRHPSSRNSDKFFIPGRILNPPKVNPEVKSWHMELVKTAKHHIIAEAIRNMCTFLEEKVFLINASNRCKAIDVAHKLHDTGLALQALQDNDYAGGTTSQILQPDNNNSRNIPNIPNTLSTRPSTSRSNRSGTQVELGRPKPISLSMSSNFKGCAFAPDGNSLVYWTDRQIILYTKSSISYTDETRPADPEVWPSDRRPSTEEERLILKHVCVTREFVVASIVGEKYLYIFNLVHGRRLGGSFRCLYRLPLVYPEADAVALSPDSRTLVYVARNNKKPLLGKASLIYMATLDVVEHFERTPSLPSTLTSSAASQVPVILKQPPEVPWPADQIGQLSLTNSRDAYLVARPRLTSNSGTLVTSILHMAITHTNEGLKTKGRFINVRPGGFDVSTNARFFTTYCVLDEKWACAVVTWTKRLRIECLSEGISFPDGSQYQQSEVEILDYRVAKLMRSSVPSTLLALGSTSSHLQMLLMRIQNFQSPVVTVLCALPGLKMGDAMSVVAVNLEASDEIRIAPLTGASRRLVYKIKVEHESS